MIRGWCNIMGFDRMGLINNLVFAFSVGLLSEKYKKCVNDVFTCGAGNDSGKIGEIML